MSRPWSHWPIAYCMLEICFSTLLLLSQDKFFCNCELKMNRDSNESWERRWKGRRKCQWLRKTETRVLIKLCSLIACIESSRSLSRNTASSFDAPCTHNMSFHFPNRFLLCFSEAHVQPSSFSAWCRKICYCCCFCWCLLAYFGCVVTAAVAWNFFPSLTATDTHRKKLLVNGTKWKLRSERSKTVMQ